MSTEQILGIKFFNGEVERAIDLICERGGVLVAPSGTCFARLRRDETYREAMINADIAIPDSGAMVLLWMLLRGHKLRRISGWKYLSHLSGRFFDARSGDVLWIVPTEGARISTARWLSENRFPFSEDDFYVAPMYGSKVEDGLLVEKIENRKPRHVIVGIGSGPQEKLGYYLREHLNYRPAVHCIGAALGFLTGEQVKIPAWADRFYLGWLFRLITNPVRFLPRLWRAIELPWLLLRYGRDLPPLASADVGRQKSDVG